MIVIVRYNAGNIFSVESSLRRLGVDPLITDDPLLIATADKVIFPGVGEASSAMNHLRQNNLDTVIKNLLQPVLGVCLGLQLLCSKTEENHTDCLDIFPAVVKKFNYRHFGEPMTKLKVPHIGWNTIFNTDSPLFSGVSENSFVYYVHSYFAELSEKSTIAKTNYGNIFSAALQRDNFYAVQFHPEKSGKTGELIYRNFLQL